VKHSTTFYFLLQLIFCGMNFHEGLFVLNAFNKIKRRHTYSDTGFDIVHLKFMVYGC